jgi:hypothetical protein
MAGAWDGFWTPHPHYFRVTRPGQALENEGQESLGTLRKTFELAPMCIGCEFGHLASLSALCEVPSTYWQYLGWAAD